MSNAVLKVRWMDQPGKRPRIIGRDTVLHAEDPNNPSPDVVGKLADMGNVYSGVLRWIRSLPASDRKQAIDSFAQISAQLSGQSGNTSPALSKDASRPKSMAEIIGSMNTAAAKFWAERAQA